MTHVYTTVNEEEQDQTYAEIESTNRRKHSSAALTYTSIKEKSLKCGNDVPPDPPTVESLMSVTQVCSTYPKHIIHVGLSYQSSY